MIILLRLFSSLKSKDIVLIILIANSHKPCITLTKKQSSFRVLIKENFFILILRRTRKNSYFRNEIIRTYSQKVSTLAYAFRIRKCSFSIFERMYHFMATFFFPLQVMCGFVPLYTVLKETLVNKNLIDEN